MDNCNVIAITNQKGGVGKTTTTVNLGVGLAHAGHRVLLIDADPQGSLTVSLGIRTPDALEVSLATVMGAVIDDGPVERDAGILHHEESVDLLPSNIVIYGHHMNDGSMFADLCGYADRDFWAEHKTIHFDTLSSFGEYEVMAAFRFNANRDTFRYNEYTNMDEAEFAEFLENVRARALYDTGAELEYGDTLLTLSTCEYTYRNGRFVVVAKKVN